jgi:hypothetical protein
MDNNPASPQSPKKGGIPLWWALVALATLVVLAVVAVGIVLHVTTSSKLQVEREAQSLKVKQEQERIDAEKASQNTALALARTRQEEVLVHARNGTNALGRLLVATKQLTTDAAALKTNENGRTVALHLDLVAQARRFYEVNFPALASVPEITSRLEGARRIEQQLVAAAGTAYQPNADLAVTAQNATLWGEQELRKVADAQTLLAGLVQESKVKVPSASLTPQSPTLVAAIDQLNQAEAALRQRAVVQRTTVAKDTAADTTAQAEVVAILAKAQAEASNIVAQANEIRAKREREQRVREAESKVEDSKAKVAAGQKVDEARNIELRKKASAPELQAKLSPFITPGYMQIYKRTYDSKPVSFTALKNYGALDPSLPGLRKLAELGCTTQDKVRPRWKLKGGARGFTLFPVEIEKVKEAQQLLIELGPVLVDMKLLEP